MNDMLKNIKTNSYKAKAEVIPKSPEQTLKLKEKKSLTITSVATTPKPQTATNKLLTQNSYSTNSMTEAKFRLTPKGNPTQKISEKRVDKFKTCQIPTTTGPLIKKSLSQSKETKPSISIPAQNSPKKTKVTLQLTDEDKNLINSIDVMKTPKKPMMGNFSTPKACSSAVTNRYAFSPEADHSKVLNILNPNNNISISTNNLKLYTNQNYQNAKFSSKSMSYVKAYSANTNQGIIRYIYNYNLEIIMKIECRSYSTLSDLPPTHSPTGRSVLSLQFMTDTEDVFVLTTSETTSIISSSKAQNSQQMLKKPSSKVLKSQRRSSLIITPSIN